MNNEKKTMTRELKFRAWDLEKGAWFVLHSGIHNVAHHIHPNILELGRDDLIIQQYTGLKDKNGKEIYEGDVVKFQMTRKVPSEGKVFAWVDETAIYQGAVKWGEFGWRPFIDGKVEECEIIGNIYSNPEILL